MANPKAPEPIPALLPADKRKMSEEAEVAEMDRKILDQQRVSSGGLADDPTESGEPVKNRHSFKITREG